MVAVVGVHRLAKRPVLPLLGFVCLLPALSSAYANPPASPQIPSDALQKQQAYWLDRSRIAIPPAHFASGNVYAIHWSLAGGLTLATNGVTGGQRIPLQPGGSLTRDELSRYPQLAKYAVLTIAPGVTVATIKRALKSQIALSAVNAAGESTYATGIPHCGVLDDLFCYPGQLGVAFRKGAVEIRQWAPTAQRVSLLLYNGGDDADRDGARADNGGVCRRGELNFATR